MKHPHQRVMGMFQILLPSDELAIRVRALTLTMSQVFIGLTTDLNRLNSCFIIWYGL